MILNQYDISVTLSKTFAKWSFAEKAVLFRQGLCRTPQMQGTESEGEILTLGVGRVSVEEEWVLGGVENFFWDFTCLSG